MTISNTGEGAEKLHLLYINGGNINGIATLKKFVGFFKN